MFIGIIISTVSGYISGLGYPIIIIIPLAYYTCPLNSHQTQHSLACSLFNIFHSLLISSEQRHWLNEFMVNYLLTCIYKRLF